MVGLLGGGLLLASSLAHGLLGWPPMREALQAASADPDLIGGLGAGWHWGSFSMAGFGAIVVAIALQQLRGGRPSTLPVGLIALTYVAFGVWAVLERGNPHFLLFVASGALVGVLVLGTGSERGSG